MNPPSLEYSSPATRPVRRRWPWRTLGLAAVVGLLFVVAPSLSLRQVSTGLDPVTGSVTRQMTWPFGFPTAPQVDVSHLETRLKNSGIAWHRSWEFYHGTHYILFGRPIGYECGAEPPIAELRSLLKAFADAATDDELREFVRVMEQGTEPEQRAAVAAACERGSIRSRGKRSDDRSS
jgi:hypothetical protein